MTDAGGGPAAAGGARGSWARWIVYLVGVAAFVWILSKVSWRDSVELLDGSVVVGEIQGDVPRAGAPDALVSLVLEDGSSRDFRVTELAAAEVGGESFPQVNEGILRIVRRSDVGLLALSVAIFGLVAQIGVARWRLLLRAQGIRLSFWAAHKLTFIGFFFNNVVPGGTGGDVVKAVYVARTSERRAPAVVSVLVDRVLGLVALAMIALFALLPSLDDPRYRELSIFILGFLACFSVAAVVFFSRRIRTTLGLEALLARLPAKVGVTVRKADEAMFAWRGHKRALAIGLALSFANQIGFQLMSLTIAAGLHITTRGGGDVTLSDYMVVLPVAFIVSSLPVLPGGWGIREGAFAVCFHFVGVDRNPAVALSVMGGMVQLLWSLLGGVYFVLGRAAGEFRPAPDPSAADDPASATPTT